MAPKIILGGIKLLTNVFLATFGQRSVLQWEYVLTDFTHQTLFTGAGKYDYIS